MIKEKLKNFLKKVLIGRHKINFIDSLIYFLSKGKCSGWIIGNKLRNFSYGKSKGKSDVPIIFIGCFPRSGSTLLTAMLEQHDSIIGPGSEVNIFQDIKTEKFLKQGFEFNEKEIKMFKKYEKNLVEYSDKILKYFLKKKKGKYVLLKQPKHIYFIKKIFKHFPNSKFIHIIRDGRDSTMSQKYFLLPPGKKHWNYKWCCRNWAIAIRKGKEFKKDKRYLEVRYEDLVLNPTETAKKIFKFLKLKTISKRKLLDYYKKFYVHKRPDHPDVAEPLKKDQINKWLKKMSEKDKKIFKDICGKEQKELGYKIENI